LACVDDVVVRTLLVAKLVLAPLVAAVALDANLVFNVNVHPHFAAERFHSILDRAGFDEGVLEGRRVGLEFILAGWVILRVAFEAVQGNGCPNDGQEDDRCNNGFHVVVVE